MQRKSFFIKLALLIVPILLIASVPLTKQSYQSIGGGGYDQPLLRILYSSGYNHLDSFYYWSFDNFQKKQKYLE
ncbi:MAG: hypothetical protein JNM71_04820 [Flavobacterium lindanitolerans]|uniref:hypothetical protein n=1 Tax=Flavobacterium lindanitolerans TaxID=428988 RepID=UPI001A646584|nr:hypothetical protein [Flavobacterium lindanitolerans]MBL7867323.1 hypothetical protein [Flavobacterium lindanitolerans]